MTIAIPYLPKLQAKPLQRVIAHAAELSGYDEHAVLRILSCLCEATADEVTRGHCVRIPAFGMFAPVRVHPRKRGTKRAFCRPAFEPTRSFRQQVAWGAPPNDEGVLALKRYNKSHCRHPDNDDGKRVFTAQQALRAKVEAQLGHAREP